MFFFPTPHNTLERLLNQLIDQLIESNLFTPLIEMLFFKFFFLVLICPGLPRRLQRLHRAGAPGRITCIVPWSPALHAAGSPTERRHLRFLPHFQRCLATHK